MITIAITKALNTAGGKMILQVDFELKKCDFISLYGKSGAGKTSLLRMLSGLMQPDSGSIKTADGFWVDVNKRIYVKPQQRNIGYVFQDYALFPNMTVKEQLKFSLKKGSSLNLIDEVITAMDIKGLEHEKPAKLSGGQKQRVALARSLVQQPEVLLLDEPLSALDREMRLKLQEYLMWFHKQYEMTTIMVSHDIAEISRLSNKVFVIEKGEIVKTGSPYDVFGKTNPKQVCLHGEIITIIDVNFAIIRIGEELIKLPIDGYQEKTFKVGDKIVVDFENPTPKIKPSP